MVLQPEILLLPSIVLVVVLPGYFCRLTGPQITIRLDSAIINIMGVLSATYSGAVRKIGKVVPQKMKPLWDSPAGPQTIFFWAPAFKWCLVFAGIGDLQRPAEKLSTSQSTALAATG